MINQLVINRSCTIFLYLG